MAFTYANLTTAILNYTEVDTSVLTATITNQIIENAELRILRDVNIDAYRDSQLGNFVTGQQYINAPAGCLIVRSVEVVDGSSPAERTYLQKRDITFINEYNKFAEGGTTTATGRGLPKYYAMYGGATGLAVTTSGTITVAPCPDSTYQFQVNFVKMPTGLTSVNTTTFISLNFGNGLLYACLVEAFSYLKGPQDMLTLYEQRYTKEIEKFAIEQVGRRRRDDYDDGAIRIRIDSPSPGP
jgi:hypothetical protein